MFIAQPSQWDASHTDLSKYFIERVKQKVDYEETISNRHKTSNGYTLINEIIEVAKLAQKRIKSIKRLESLVNEAKSILSSSIVNDYILQEYHPDIIEYYKKINVNKLSEGNKDLIELLNKSKIFSLRLDKEYIINIKKEINNIDFSSTHFERNALIIDKVINCVIPYLLYKGYSVTGISNVAYRLMKKRNGQAVARQFLSTFNSNIKHFQFLIDVLPNSTEEVSEIEKYLKQKEVVYEFVKIDDIKEFLYDAGANIGNGELILITHKTLDPHNYLRNLYEMSLKNYVISKDRLDLNFYTDFFERAYWRFNLESHKFQRSNISLDSINVMKRKSTLRYTLEVLNQSYKLNFSSDAPIPNIPEIRDCIYYYNLALGSKSIENSLSLLWTCLETLIPYKMRDNDIQNVQYFIVKALSIGAIGSEITSFATRFVTTSRQNPNSLDDLGIHTSYINYHPDGVKKWIYWLAEDYQIEGKKDPYESFKPISNLLCKIFCDLNNIYLGKGDYKVDYWLEKLNKTEAAYEYQLDRIYLHRNQIVHSGKFINEYSNLWSHLEWYVGKLLSYCVINYVLMNDKSAFSKEKLFMELEGDYDMLRSFLEKNIDKKINEVPSIYSLITKHSWQFF